MSSFLVIKKNLELSAGSGARMLVGKQNRAIPAPLSPLPYDSEIEYLESTGTQWIDTGIVPDSYTEVYAKLMSIESVPRGMFAGTDVDGDPNGTYYVFRYPENDPDTIGFAINYLDFINTTLSTNVIFEITQNQIGTRKLIVNNTQIGTFSGTINVNLSLFLFTVNSTASDRTSSLAVKCRCYKCTIKSSDGTLVRDFIPVRVGQTGYMYDKVSGELFGNQGSGNFVLGDDLSTYKFRYVRTVLTTLKKHFDVSVEVDFDSAGGTSCESAAYVLGKPYGSLPEPTRPQHIFKGWWTTLSGDIVPIEYLESTGTQWIDAGIIPNSLYGFEIDSSIIEQSGIDTYSAAGIEYDWCNKSLVIWRWNGGCFVLYGDTLVNVKNSISGLMSRHKISIKQNCVFVDDNLAYTFQQQTFNCTGSITIGRWRRTIDSSVNPDANCCMRLYGAKVWDENQNLKLDLIPVRISQTGYMYDKVSGQLLENQGSGNFTLGDDLPDSSENAGIQITEESLVELYYTTLYARWQFVDIGEDRTEYVVQTTSSYKKTGIYQANRYDSSQPIYVDWGDGNVDVINGNINQLTHEYSDAGTYHVKISNNLTSFGPSYGDYTWYNTTSQNRYTFKDVVKTGSNVVSMPTYAFYYCAVLSSIDFLNSCYTTLTTLPNYAFEYCQSIPTLSVLPNRIKNIRNWCFAYCTGLTGIQDLRNTGLMALDNERSLAYCNNVKEWKLPSTFTGLHFGNCLFYQNSNLSAIDLPSSLIGISQGCFSECSLKKIEIPANVMYIASTAFNSNHALTSVTYLGNAVTSIGDYAFAGCNQLTTSYLPDSIKQIGQYAFRNCYSFSGNLVLPSSLTAMGNRAYQYCYNIETLSLPSSLTSIGDYAFAGCNSISSISAYRMSAPTVNANTFGNNQNTGENQYTGYNTSGNNQLYVYAAATGYEDNAWDDPLQNATKCGFNVKYFDPENLEYCTVTLDARAGSVNPSSLTCIQDKKIRDLPIPTASDDLPNFIGWFTERHGEGAKYTADSIAPSQTALTLYAYFTEVPATLISVDLNNAWQINTEDNPDPALYDMYESYSNQYEEEGASLALMKIHVSGCTQLSIYIRSYAESDYDYCVAFNEDFDAGNTDWWSYTEEFEWVNFNDLECTKITTSGNQDEGTSVDSYVLVTYQLDGGEHDIWIAHRKDGSVSEGNDQSYVLIPKNQSGGGGEADMGICLEDGETELYDENQQDQIVMDD